MRQLSESENRADTNVEVIDSWEDLEAPVDDETNVPRSIEFPVKEKIETPVPKKEEPVRYFYELRTGQNCQVLIRAPSLSTPAIRTRKKDLI